MKSSRQWLLELETFIKAATNPLQEWVGGHGTNDDATVIVVGECQNWWTEVADADGGCDKCGRNGALVWLYSNWGLINVEKPVWKKCV